MARPVTAPLDDAMIELTAEVRPNRPKEGQSRAVQILRPRFDFGRPRWRGLMETKLRAGPRPALLARHHERARKRAVEGEDAEVLLFG
jgi:hypothetical protein